MYEVSSPEYHKNQKRSSALQEIATNFFPVSKIMTIIVSVTVADTYFVNILTHAIDIEMLG